MKIKLLFLLVVSSLFSVSAEAVTAGKLKQYCATFAFDQTDKSANSTFCVGYFDGWIEAVNGRTFLIDGKPFFFKFAEGFTIGKAIRPFYEYVNAHPEVEGKGLDYVLTGVLLDSKMMLLLPGWGESAFQLHAPKDK